MTTSEEEDKAKPPSPDELSDIDSLNSSDSEGENDGSNGSDVKGTDEPIEWLVTSRAKRSTAGNRMKSMLTNEEPAAEDSDLELLFAEDEDDAGFTDDAGDDSDVQMDSSSDDEDDQNNADELDGEKELERQAREKKAAARKRKTQEAIPAKFRKKVRIDTTVSAAESVASPRSTVATPQPPRPKKKSERASWLPSPADMPVRASERSTTRISKQQLHQKMVTDEIRRKKQVEKMEKKAKLLEALKKPPMTQAERLAEAALVEKRNAKSLNRWEEAEKQREEERMRKIAALNSRKLDGPVVTFWTGIQELSDAQSNHVGNLVSMEVKAPRKKRQSAAAALAAREAAANGEQPPETPITPLTPVDKEKEGVKIDGKDAKMDDAPAPTSEVKTETTEGLAFGNAPTGPVPAAGVAPTVVPSANLTMAPPPPRSVLSASVQSGSLASTSVPPAPARASPAPVPPAPAPSASASAASSPIPPRPVSAASPGPPAAAPASPVSAPPASIPVVSAPPVSTPLATAPSSMTPPPIPPPPDTRPSSVLAAPILAPPAGSPMQMPMLGFPNCGAKFSGLAAPNTSHTPSPLSMPPSMPAAPTPVKPKPTLITSTVSAPASKVTIQPPPLPNTPMTPATPLTSAQSARKDSLIPPTPTTLPPDTPQEGAYSATEPLREGGKVTRSCIILQNFDETAIKDKQVQTQILFGRKMARLAKPAQPPVCVITGNPAKYRDPETGLPYYNSYAYREIQRVHRGSYKYSSLIGAYVGRGDYAAKGVPDRFRDPSLPGPVKKRVAEPVLVPIEGAEAELNKEEETTEEKEASTEKKSPVVGVDEPRLVPIDPPKETPKAASNEASKSGENASPTPAAVPAAPQPVASMS